MTNIHVHLDVQYVDVHVHIMVRTCKWYNVHSVGVHLHIVTYM